MQKSSVTLFVSENIGAVSAEIVAGETPKAIFTLAHGAGAGMNHPFMTALANELLQHDIGTLRFNFPYMEQKKRRPDVPAVAHKTVEAAINKVNELFPKVPLFVSGKSFGGRMSSQFLSKSKSESVKGIIFFGFPLHTPKSPATERAEHLKDVKVPMLFLQGTRDELADWSLMEKVTSEFPLATLHKLDGADHAFKAGKQNLIPILASVSSNWIDKLLKV